MMYRMGYLAWALAAAAVVPGTSRAGGPGLPEGGKSVGAGERLYLEKCSQCHGDHGDGKGVGAEFFRPLPRDFTSGAFKIRTTESGELPTDEDIKSIIKRGMPYTGMPAWPDFSDGELTELARHIKSFNSDFADTSLHPKVIDIPKPPASSEESIKRGKILYVENKCMDCHGALGRGDGESAPTLNDDWGNPIRPADLTRRWTFRGGPHREDIYRTFMTGLNGTPMPSYAASIEEKDRWALVDYVHSLSPADAPDYAALVTAEAVPDIDAAKGRALFQAAKPALFPVVGQVIEGERGFFPGANAVEVRAVYDSGDIAILVSWHDMSAQKEGGNSPVVAPAASAAGPPGASAKAAGLSDAVAVQLPLKAPEGPGKPYFLFGDKKNPVELWFRDQAKESADAFLGKGGGNLAPKESGLTTLSGYEDGEWWTLFIRKRVMEKRYPIDIGAFTPIAFSVWDGGQGETGDKRGVTSWYSLYLKPAATESPFVPAAKRALAALSIGVGLVLAVRKRMASRK